MAAALGSLEPEAAAAITTQKRCRAAEQDKRGGGQPDKRNGGWSETRMERSGADKEEGRETRTHTQKSEKGSDKGITRGEETTWGRAFLTWSAPSTLLLSLSACPVRRRQSREAELWVERPYPRGFFLFAHVLHCYWGGCDQQICKGTWSNWVSFSPTTIFIVPIPKNAPWVCHSHQHLPANQKLVPVNAGSGTGMDQLR